MLASIGDASAVVYSIGSLFTSIVPCLILRDVGKVIGGSSSSSLSSSNLGGGSGSAGVKYKILILNGSLDRETRAAGKEFSAKDFVAAIADACVSSRSSLTLSPQEAGTLNAREEEYKDYVSHVIHLQGEGTPRVEKEELSRLGIECVKTYGRKTESDDGDGGMIYDGKALGQALEAIIGGPKKFSDRSRRNTLGISGVGG